MKKVALSIVSEDSPKGVVEYHFERDEETERFFEEHPELRMVIRGKLLQAFQEVQDDLEKAGFKSPDTNSPIQIKYFGKKPGIVEIKQA